MITLAEVFQNPLYTLCIGLALGLWVAVQAYIIGRGRGYGQGVRYCMKEFEPVRIEIAAMAGLHDVSEDMRQRMADAQAPDKETRH